VLEFGEGERGKRVYAAARWVNNTMHHGPWRKRNPPSSGINAERIFILEVLLRKTSSEAFGFCRGNSALRGAVTGVRHGEGRR